MFFLESQIFLLILCADFELGAQCLPVGGPAAAQQFSQHDPEPKMDQKGQQEDSKITQPRPKRNADKCKKTTKFSVLLGGKSLTKIGGSDALYFMFLGYLEFRQSARARGVYMKPAGSIEKKLSKWGWGAFL